MSYSPIYTSEADVEAITQVDITDTTKPNSSQVLNWIEEIEKGVIERALGSHTATDVLVDVPSQEEVIGFYSAIYRARTGQLIIKTALGGGVLVPLANVKHPIVSITSLFKNDESLNDAPDWKQLTEGPGDGTSFILLESDSLGYALWFYDNFPLPGPKRLKMTYQYGYNIDSKILREYCTLGVAVKVLEAKRGLSEGGGLTEFVAGEMGTYIPTHYVSRIEMFKARMKEIEQTYFPKEFGFAII